MSSQELTYRGMFHTLIASALLLFMALFVAGCGGGASSSTTGKTGTTSRAVAIALKADAGAVCETLLTGASYSSTLPPLSCNHGPDSYTAYLDGSNSASSDGAALSYAWSFVSKPSGSNAALIGANTVKPTFVPDKAGAYTVQLVVSAEGFTSPRAVALVIALDDATLNPNPTTNPGAMPYHFHGGLSNNCSECHSGTNSALPSKPSTHIATSNMCQACHSPKGFTVANFVDHAEVFGTCSSCHNGVIAIGKSPVHLATTAECNVCHTTTSFVTLSANGTFDHSTITSPCSACHNGTVAIGTSSDPSPTGHPSISVECNNCHTTTTFSTPFLDHSNPAVVAPGTCGQAGCHDGMSTMANGVAITGKNSAPHPHPSTGDITIACDQCHNTTSYNMAGLFNHNVLATHPIACKSCHDGLNATGQIANHIPTGATSDCSNCHNTSTFVGGFVDHTTSIVTSQNCTACHDGTRTWSFVDSNGVTNTLPIPGAPTSPQTLAIIHTDAINAGDDCGVCHTAGGSFSLATVDHSGFGTLGAITLPAGFACSECHNGAIATGKLTSHIVTTQDCGACHDPQRTTFAGAAFDHSGVSVVGKTANPACSSCHDGTQATGRSITHVPTSGQDCLVCHGTGFSSFAMSSFDHIAAGITKNCASCHDGAAHDGVIVISRPAGHIPTSDDCSKCHADTTNGPNINGTAISGFAKADPFVNTVHPAYTTGCRTCHNGSYDNAIYLARRHPTDSVHATVDANGWDCNACHTTTGKFMETNPVNHQDPIIQAQACISCHADGRTTEPVGRGPSHPTTSTVCQNCHAAGGSFAAAFDHTTLDGGGVNSALANSCATCHDGVNATGKPQHHVPTSRDCSACHVGHPPTATSFAGGTFDHSGPEMTGKTCTNCHSGTILGASGKPANHIVTNADCGSCHSTVTFANATGFDHTGVTSGCQAGGCHAAGTSGVMDVTDDPNRTHIPIVNAGTEADCYSCHKNPGVSFAGASMDHTVVTFEGCEFCHDGTHDGANAAHIATPQSSGHIVSKTPSNSITACATCHTSTSNWSLVSYRHSATGHYPGDHSTRRVTTCTQCHTDTNPVLYEISTFDTSQYTPYCAVCHLSQYRSGHGGTPDKNHEDCGRSGCHRVSSSDF